MTIRYRMEKPYGSVWLLKQGAVMGAGRYDVIVVGARVAGAATAMLLARQGLRVLAVDRVSFPSDTISSHQLQVPGAALLNRWGLLAKLTAAGTPPTRRVRFDAGGDLVMTGQYPEYDGVDALYSPRRTLLDSILVEAAREAGAEVRENFRVTQLAASGDRVTGIQGTGRGGAAVTETANLVIGADGKRSLVARAGTASGPRSRLPPIPTGLASRSPAEGSTSGRGARWPSSQQTTSSP
jgi:2-polyprenyl-6-methoxyphenol hydroxylase-like FAD-dependent oxidoreductase